MQRIVRWCLKNKSVVILATILLIGSGVYATTRLNQELLPDISFPIITISTPVAGAGPDLVDEQVTQPVEDAINGVQGIQAVQSTSSQGFSVVVVEFDLDADTEEAESDLQAALDGIQLPFAGGRSRGQEPVGFAVSYPVALAGRRGPGSRRPHKLRRGRGRPLHRGGRRCGERRFDRGRRETHPGGSRPRQSKGEGPLDRRRGRRAERGGGGSSRG